jgi:GTP cyclohydrolase I
MSRVKLTKIPTANGNMPLSDEEKQQVIEEASRAYEKFLDALRIDWRNDPNSDGTPRRVAKAYVNDIASGCYNELPNITAFPSDGYDGIVFQGGIPVKSLCSHHHLAFTGRCHVAYIPSQEGKVIGLSKLNRIVEHFARRPQIQEGLTMQIHEAIDKICEGNKGVAVMLTATHTCACNRGIKHDGCEMKTSKISGDFMEDDAARNEFYYFINDWKRNH